MDVLVLPEPAVPLHLPLPALQVGDINDADINFDSLIDEVRAPAQTQNEGNQAEDEEDDDDEGNQPIQANGTESHLIFARSMGINILSHHHLLNHAPIQPWPTFNQHQTQPQPQPISGPRPAPSSELLPTDQVLSSQYRSFRDDMATHFQARASLTSARPGGVEYAICADYGFEFEDCNCRLEDGYRRHPHLAPNPRARVGPRESQELQSTDEDDAIESQDGDIIKSGILSGEEADLESMADVEGVNLKNANRGEAEREAEHEAEFEEDDEAAFDSDSSYTLIGEPSDEEEDEMLRDPYQGDGGGMFVRLMLAMIRGRPP